VFIFHSAGIPKRFLIAHFAPLSERDSPLSLRMPFLMSEALARKSFSYRRFLVIFPSTFPHSAWPLSCLSEIRKKPQPKMRISPLLTGASEPSCGSSPFPLTLVPLFIYRPRVISGRAFSFSIILFSFFGSDRRWLDILLVLSCPLLRGSPCRGTAKKRMAFHGSPFFFLDALTRPFSRHLY